MHDDDELGGVPADRGARCAAIVSNCPGVLHKMGKACNVRGKAPSDASWAEGEGRPVHSYGHVPTLGTWSPAAAVGAQHKGAGVQAWAQQGWNAPARRVSAI